MILPHPRIWTSMALRTRMASAPHTRLKERRHQLVPEWVSAMSPWHLPSPPLCKELSGAQSLSDFHWRPAEAPTFRGTCPSKTEESEFFKTSLGDRSLISLQLFLNDKQVPCLSETEVSALFAEKKKISFSWHSGKSFCTTFATKSLRISPFYFINTLFWIWDIPGGPKVKKKNLKRKNEKKNSPSTVKRKRILNLFRANVGCDPLLSPLDKFPLQAKLFSLETAIMRNIPKSLKKNILHGNNVMYLMYSDSHQHAGHQIPFMSMCCSSYILALDTCP